MPDISLSRKWTIEKLTEIARKYSFKGDFAKNDCAAYIAAKKYGVFEKVVSHMGIHNTTSEKSKPQDEAASKNKIYICDAYESGEMSIANIALKLQISRIAVKEVL